MQGDTILTGYQNTNGTAPPSPVQQMDADWDWDEVLAPELAPMGYQQANAAVVSNPAQQPQEDWDFASDFGGEDGWSNHYTAYDLPQVFGFEWDWDEFVGGDFRCAGERDGEVTGALGGEMPRDGIVGEFYR